MKFRAKRSTAGIMTPEQEANAGHTAPSVDASPRVPPQQPAGPRSAPPPQQDAALIRASAALVAPYADQLPVFFYSTLFNRYPQVRELFPPDLNPQQDRLVRALLMIVELVDDPANLVAFCSHLGRDHRKFGTRSAHYGAVGEVLLATLEHFAGPAWTPEVAAAWTRAYTTVAEVMDQAAEADARVNPAAWEARIVAHRRHGQDLAEFTVRPDHPFPFTGGQYVSMETPWAPRVWRYYSPANAPRPDGTLTFHVRAVTGGRVSNALVRRAAVGDTVRLGPAQGDMVLDPRSPRDVVCVAGGTGLAPVRALIEQAALDGVRRRMDVFLGSRTAADLYGLDELLSLGQRHRWLHVRAAIADQDAHEGPGYLPKVLAEAGPWDRHDAYLAGPGPMIVTAGRVLMRAGMPLERIHHDPFVTLEEPTT
ncbi:globin domain-containing protein [Kitasatospora sp. NPDC058965]|uniref:globin domain-containing protein n=1 Tax=Kitasatospora sp. NPDC058965 TaxID=3346682 RepID=UPI0036A823D9